MPHTPGASTARARAVAVPAVLALAASAVVATVLTAPASAARDQQYRNRPRDDASMPAHRRKATPTQT